MKGAMKKTKRQRRSEPAPAVGKAGQGFVWWPWIAAFAALSIVYQVYSPALEGAFVFDDRYLPFLTPQVQNQPLSAWLTGNRPLLMVSFWLNYQAGGIEPGGYHAVNVLLHFMTSVLITLALLRLLKWNSVERPVRELLAVFGGALFLLHPLQTESVAYIASRSETLSVFLYFAAYVVFLYRPEGPVSWLRMAAIATLTAAAVATKEHTLTLPALLLLTDLFWNPKGWRENLRMYIVLAAGGAVGAAWVASILLRADTAGFRVAGLGPLEYFLTQCRVIWTYVRMFVLPYGQTIDPDVRVSTSLLDPVAILGLIALLGLAAAAWRFRKRWPLACFGVFVFLLLLAPTSSVVPILDPMAERRVYLPFLGLALVAIEGLRRLTVSQIVGTGAVVLGLASLVTYQRNEVWTSPITLWEDAVDKAPDKVRPRFQLAYAHYEIGQCPEAVTQYGAAAELEPPNQELLIDWALALDCAGDSAEALRRLGEAAELDNTAHVRSLMGMVYGKLGQRDAALRVLAEAEQIDPNFDTTYVYRGNVYETEGSLAAAAQEYRHALALNPANSAARDGLGRVNR